MDTYRPSYNHYPPPPPPPPPLHSMPPLPRGPPPPQNGRGGDSYRPPPPPQSDFSFRSNDYAPYAPQYPRESEYTGSGRPKEYHRRENDRGRRGNTNGDNMNLNRPGRGNFHKPHQNYRAAPADRPLLRHHDAGASSEQLLGMTSVQKFMATDDVSDSEEEQMDESNSDVDQSDPDKTDNATLPTTADIDSSVETSLEPAAKRRAVGSNAPDGNIAPKWSNPDPYTVLPPVDEAQRKKKDVVKLIRKARMDAEANTNDQSQVAANDDFISFGMDDSKEDIPSSFPGAGDRDDFGRGVPGAPSGPSGPRPFSHLENLHSQDAPGTNGVALSASSLGPPPSRESSSQKYMEGNVNQTISNSTGNTEVEARNGSYTEPEHALSRLETEGINARLDIGSKYDHEFETRAIADLGGDDLGNRKRTYNDVIKGNKKGGERINGSILYEWLPYPGKNPTPWISSAEAALADTGYRLHREVHQFYDFVKPQAFEQTIREELLERLQAVFSQHIPNSRVLCFGSFAAGLYLPNADMDIVVVSDSFLSTGRKLACQSHSQLYRFGHFIQDSSLAHGKVEVIAQAKVPIVKFVDRITKIKVDVSFENDTGVVANDTFLDWSRQFPAMPVLVTVIKQFLMMRGLNEVVFGGLGGFSVTCLVTSLLQHLPGIQSGDLIPEHHLGQILMSFLDFYGNQFDIQQTGIMMRPPGYFFKEVFRGSRKRVYQANKFDRLAIMDPNRPDNDISGGSRLVLQIFDRFAQAHKEILRAMEKPGCISLLAWPLGGNYDIFTSQRDHLLHLYRQGSRTAGEAPNQDRNSEGGPPSGGAPPKQAREVVTVDIMHNHPGTASNSVGINAPSEPNNPTLRNIPQYTSAQISDSARPAMPIKVAKSKTQKPLLAPNETRAQTLQQEFPEMKDIPKEITREEFKALRAAYLAPVKPKVVKKSVVRARVMKKHYPGMQVPNKVSKKQRKHLIEAYTARPSEETAKGKVKTETFHEKQLPPLPIKNSRRLFQQPSPRQQMTYRTRQVDRFHESQKENQRPVVGPIPEKRTVSNKMAPLSEDRRAEVARHLGGSSINDPIGLD